MPKTPDTTLLEEEPPAVRRESPAQAALTGDGPPKAVLGDGGGGDPGDRDRGEGGRGPRRLCPRCHVYYAIPELFHGKEGPLCAICGTDDILGWGSSDG